MHNLNLMELTDNHSVKNFYNNTSFSKVSKSSEASANFSFANIFENKLSVEPNPSVSAFKSINAFQSHHNEEAFLDNKRHDENILRRREEETIYHQRKNTTGDASEMDKKVEKATTKNVSNNTSEWFLFLQSLHKQLLTQDAGNGAKQVTPADGNKVQKNQTESLMQRAKNFLNSQEGVNWLKHNGELLQKLGLNVNEQKANINTILDKLDSFLPGKIKIKIKGEAIENKQGKDLSLPKILSDTENANVHSKKENLHKDIKEDIKLTLHKQDFFEKRSEKLQARQEIAANHNDSKATPTQAQAQAQKLAASHLLSLAENAKTNLNGHHQQAVTQSHKLNTTNSVNGGLNGGLEQNVAFKELGQSQQQGSFISNGSSHSSHSGHSGGSSGNANHGGGEKSNAQSGLNAKSNSKENSNGKSSFTENFLIKQNQTNHNYIKDFSKLQSGSNVNPRAIIQKLTMGIKMGVVQGKQLLTIAIKPEHLGKISIHLSKEKGSFTAKLLVENKQIKEMLEAKMSDVLEQIKAQNISMSELVIDIDNKNNMNGNLAGKFSGDGDNFNLKQQANKNFSHKNKLKSENDSSESLHLNMRALDNHRINLVT